MKLALTFCIAFIVAILTFAVYFCCVAHLFRFGRSLAEFSAMFQPLEALFTALAFLAIAIVASAQSKDCAKQSERQQKQSFALYD